MWPRHVLIGLEYFSGLFEIIDFPGRIRRCGLEKCIGGLGEDHPLAAACGHRDGG